MKYYGTELNAVSIETTLSHSDDHKAIFYTLQAKLRFNVKKFPYQIEAQIFMKKSEKLQSW